MLSPKRAAELELAKLSALVPVASAELWLQRLGWPLAVAVRVGTPMAAGQAQIEARAVIETGQPTAAGKRSDLVGVRVLDEKDLLAALLLRPVLANRARARLLAQRAAAFLAPLLIRADVLQENAACERAPSSPAQRRLQGLGYELHDGALQGLAALAQEAQVLGRDLEKVVPQAELARILDHVDDLKAGLQAIDADLREVVRLAGRPAVGRRSLRESLELEFAYFRAISEIEGDTVLKGDFDGLTPSQRATAVRVVQEALRNIRKHSSSSRADLQVVEDDYSIVIEIVDYGQGFNVESELGQAGETGRLGLIGMSERLRIAGGALSIDSRPGGPTSVRAILPRWIPAASQQYARR
jgi:signal transduction histidine kinase